MPFCFQSQSLSAFNQVKVRIREATRRWPPKQRESPELANRGPSGGLLKEPLRKWGAAAQTTATQRCPLASARQGRTTKAMLKHRRGVLTPYGAATPLCPLGYGGTGPSASLGLLAVAHGYAFEPPPPIWPRGARNAARPTYADSLSPGPGLAIYPLTPLRPPSFQQEGLLVYGYKAPRGLGSVLLGFDGSPQGWGCRVRIELPW